MLATGREVILGGHTHRQNDRPLLWISRIVVSISAHPEGAPVGVLCPLRDQLQ